MNYDHDVTMTADTGHKLDWLLYEDGLYWASDSAGNSYRVGYNDGKWDNGRSVGWAACLEQVQPYGGWELAHGLPSAFEAQRTCYVVSRMLAEMAEITVQFLQVVPQSSS